MRAIALAALFCGLPAFAAESGGQADIVLQGYSLGGNAQAPERIGGVAVNFSDFLPGLGMLSGNLEGYGNGQFQTGDNFLELRGVPWLGRRWTFRGGDFQTPATLVDFPFYNVFNPEVNARGGRIATIHGATEYEFFYGRETLEEGPQLPFRVNAPQNLMGAAVRYKRGRLQAGLRYLRFSSSPRDILGNPFLFPAGRAFATVDSFTAQALYRLVRNLRLFAEASGSAARQAAVSNPGTPEPFSTFSGFSWEIPKLTARANYAYQGSLYFPLAGYFAGDRQGPFAEMQYRPWKSMELLGSASNYRNNLERNPDVATFQSTSASAGATIKLPWASTGMFQVSAIRFSEQPAGVGVYSDSSNRHMSVGLAHPFHNHMLRFAVHDLKFTANSLPDRQRWAEAEDTLRIKRLILGANVRMQQDVSGQRRNTIYVRGLVELNARRFTLFGNVETGNDLINQTVFATNTYRTTVAGMTAHLDRYWDVQVEALRNTLNMVMNPENIFVLESGGIGLSNALSSLDQWSLFVRLKRHLQWGRPLPSGDLATYVDSQLPLEGSVEGFVHEQRISGERPAAGVPVTLDGNRTVNSDGDGRFRFSEVPEGVHHVMLSRAELPADYDPGNAGEAVIAVHPRRTSRADFTVVRLTSLTGLVNGPANVALENIVVRLLPGVRYTTTTEDGRFVFHNLREGDYELVVDPGPLPEGAELTGAGRMPVAVRLDTTSPEIHFDFRRLLKQKAIRKVDLN